MGRNSLLANIVALIPSVISILEVRYTVDCVDLKRVKLPKTRISLMYSAIYSQISALPAAAATSLKCRWTTNSLEWYPRWHSSYRTIWLRLSSDRWQYAFVYETRFSRRSCHTTHLIWPYLAPSSHLHLLLWTWCAMRIAIMHCSSLHCWPPAVL